MKLPPFHYHAPATLEEALVLLAAHGPDAKVLAGGQSLLPLMKLRLVEPRVLIDLNRVRSLSWARADERGVRLGATTRVAALESEEVRRVCPLLAQAAAHIGHLAIRHVGTVCGSLAHADPAAELPVVAMALDAEVLTAGPNGSRRIAARDFFVTYYTTSLAPGEVLVEADFPRLSGTAGWAFIEFSRRRGDFALVSVAAVIDGDGVGPPTARIALGGVAERPVRALEAEAALRQGELTPAAFGEAAAMAARALDPPSDVHAPGEYRRHLARVLVEEALRTAWDRIPGNTPRRS